MTRMVRPGLRADVLEGKPLPAWLLAHSRSDRIIKAALSAPPWVDRKALRRLEAKAREMTRKTGIKHVLDHLVPVDHPYVCGLTVPWNLQVIPQKVNCAKGNSFHPDQSDAFDECEQFGLFT